MKVVDLSYVGPLVWAPFSEVFGRRILFIVTFVALTAFNAGSAGAQNIWTHIILRFFAGAFGASSFANVRSKFNCFIDKFL